MSEWNPSVVKIERVDKHPNADTLSIYTVLGDYPVIDKTDKYQLGELVSYIPIDTIVSATADFYFLCPMQTEKYLEDGEIKSRVLCPQYPLADVPEKYRRIRSKKIRQVYSQGILLPAVPNIDEGSSIIEHFDLKKWEEEEEENIIVNGKKKSGGANAEKSPSSWSIPRYDVEGLRKYLNCIDPEEEITITEKLNGSNFSGCHDGERLWIKSRNYYKRDLIGDPWWDAAHRMNLTEKLQKYPMLAFFGELAGQVKGFRYDCIENNILVPKVYFFDIYDVKSGQFLDYDRQRAILKELDLPAVPELFRGKWEGKEKMYPYAEGQSCVGEHIREGFTLRYAKERFEPKLGGRFQLKLVGEGYTLQKK